MRVHNRFLALTIAAMLLLSTMGFVFLTSASAAENSKIKAVSVTSSPRKFSAGDRLNSLTISIKDEDLNDFSTGAVEKKMEAIQKATFTFNESSSFRRSNTGDIRFQVKNVTRESSTSKTILYDVEVTNLEYTGNGSSFQYRIDMGGSYGAWDVKVDVSDLVDSGSSSGSSGDSGEDPVVPSDSSQTYVVTKVYRYSTYGDTTKPSTVTFDMDDQSMIGRGDATIRQGYYADILVTVKDNSAPGGDYEVTLGASSVLGSFIYQQGVSAVKSITDKEPGSFTFLLEKVRYSGTRKNLECFILGDNYKTTVSLEISECKTRSEAEEEKEKNDDTPDYSNLERATPYVIISNYGYGGGQVSAGDTFPLSLTFYNTSSILTVNNMMITVSMPDDLMLTSSSNTFYVENLGRHETITKSMMVTAKPAAAAQSHNITVSMRYQYVDDKVEARKSAETSETIAIPVVQVDRFQATGVELDPEIYIGEESNLTVNFVNKGRSEVYNLSAEIAGTITNPGQQQNLGNLASGATGTADFYITPSAEGQVTGEVTITYEDTNMVEKTITVPFSTNAVDPMGGMNPGMDIYPGMGDDIQPVEEEKSILPIVIVVAVAVLIPAAVVIKKKIDKKRSEMEDADL